jgi:hypothetical protein
MAEEIEFHRRGHALMSYIAAIGLAALGIIFVILACIEASEPDPWSQKWQSVLEWLVAAAPLLLATQKLWVLGRSYRHNVVRFAASAVTFRTLGGKQFEIPYLKIRSVKFEPAVNKGLLSIETAETNYQFDSRACPRADAVAKLILQRIARPAQN